MGDVFPVYGVGAAGGREARRPIFDKFDTARLHETDSFKKGLEQSDLRSTPCALSTPIQKYSNPSGARGSRAISLSFLLDDAPASPPPLFATSPREPRPHTSPYLRTGVLSLALRACAFEPVWLPGQRLGLFPRSC